MKKLWVVGMLFLLVVMANASLAEAGDGVGRNAQDLQHGSLVQASAASVLQIAGRGPGGGGSGGGRGSGGGKGGYGPGDGTGNGTGPHDGSGNGPKINCPV